MRATASYDLARPPRAPARAGRGRRSASSRSDSRSPNCTASTSSRRPRTASSSSTCMPRTSASPTSASSGSPQARDRRPQVLLVPVTLEVIGLEADSRSSTGRIRAARLRDRSARAHAASRSGRCPALLARTDIGALVRDVAGGSARARRQSLRVEDQRHRAAGDASPAARPCARIDCSRCRK